MRNWLLGIGLSLLWQAAGRLGRDLKGWIDDAEGHGLSGRGAFDYVWRKAKTRFPDTGEWLLNLLIEAVLGKQRALEGKLKKKLRWPKKLTPHF